MSEVILRSGAAGAPLQSEYGTEDLEEVDGLAADGVVRGVSGGVFVRDSLPYVHRDAPDQGINLRLTVLVLPTVSGGVQDVVGGGAHCLDGGGGLVGDVVGDLGGGQHGIVAVTDLLITILVAVAAEVIGQNEALEAPLVTEHGVQQVVGGTGIGVTDVVEGAHHSLCAAFLHAHLERLEVDLADGLLVRPGTHHVGTVGFLIVQSEVLHEGVHALLLGTGSRWKP